MNYNKHEYFSFRGFEKKRIFLWWKDHRRRHSLIKTLYDFFEFTFSIPGLLFHELSHLCFLIFFLTIPDCHILLFHCFKNKDNEINIQHDICFCYNIIWGSYAGIILVCIAPLVCYVGLFLTLTTCLLTIKIRSLWIILTIIYMIWQMEVFMMSDQDWKTFDKNISLIKTKWLKIVHKKIGTQK